MNKNLLRWRLQHHLPVHHLSIRINKSPPDRCNIRAVKYLYKHTDCTTTAVCRSQLVCYQQTSTVLLSENLRNCSRIKPQRHFYRLSSSYVFFFKTEQLIAFIWTNSHVDKLDTPQHIPESHLTFKQHFCVCCTLKRCNNTDTGTLYFSITREMWSVFTCTLFSIKGAPPMLQAILVVSIEQEGQNGIKYRYTVHQFTLLKGQRVNLANVNQIKCYFIFNGQNKVYLIATSYPVTVWRLTSLPS